MSKPVTGLTTFAGTPPPWNLSNLDGDIAALQTAINDYNTYSNPLTDTSGSANAITVTSPASLTASYVTGLLLYIKVANTTTSTTVTVNLNGLGNLNVKLPNGQNPPIALILSGGVYAFYYDGTNLQLVGMNPVVFSAAGDASITAPSSGTALTVAGAAGASTLILNSGQNATSSVSDMVLNRAGSTANAIAEGPSIQLKDSVAVTATGLQHSGGQSELWQFNGSWIQLLKVDPNQAWTINAAASGHTTLTINGAVGGFTAQNIVGGGASGNNFGLFIQAGTTSADYGLNVENSAATLQAFRVRGDGVVLGNDGTNLIELGYKDLPQNLQTASYALVLADRGKHILFSSGTDTLTIPANASVAFPIGTTIVVINGSGANLTVQITTDTLAWLQGGSSSTGTRTVANNSIITLLKYATTSWAITGQGIS